MNWNLERDRSGSSKDYSIIKKLRMENKINNNFLSTLDELQLEDLIAIKLELASKAAGGYLYGLPILHSVGDMVKEGIYKFALSCTRSKKEAARVIGTTPKSFYTKIKTFDLEKEVKKSLEKKTKV